MKKIASILACVVLLAFTVSVSAMGVDHPPGKPTTEMVSKDVMNDVSFEAAMIVENQNHLPLPCGDDPFTRQVQKEAKSTAKESNPQANLHIRPGWTTAK